MSVKTKLADGSETHIIIGTIAGCKVDFTLTVNHTGSAGTIKCYNGSFYVNRSDRDGNHQIIDEQPLVVFTNGMGKPVATSFNDLLHGTELEEIDFRVKPTSSAPDTVDLEIMPVSFKEHHPGERPPLPGIHAK